MATNSVELTPAFTGPTRRISGSFSPATWHSSSTMARRCRCLPAMSSLRTELATGGAWLETCRPPWLLSSSEPSAVRIRPAREVTIAVTREDRCVVTGTQDSPRGSYLLDHHRMEERARLKALEALFDPTERSDDH